ncbi:di-heme oxidoreductase family protein [Polaribacter sargassicola]|uniref:di-heme oxidoreductase family protein n=1 Tax=Polaribacter sargassicola TaxID=2836891 RepID=UPI001F3AB1D4|nr:di-heme oxidoredictase family protein [Polaribacter sp. DS7-9]MCG1037032.1 thiol oxidoreductase [Polaribacter sp. DS7-9]
MKYLYIGVLIFICFSCTSDGLSDEEYISINYELDEEKLVSDLSIEAFTADKAFGRGIPILSDLELAFFGVGNAMFDQSWVSAPASTTSRDGLGQIFNARACSACHLRDGRGKPVLENGAGSEGFLIRLSSGNDLITGPIGFGNYGDQLQDDSNLGIDKEGTINVHFETITGTYPDGETYELRKPIYTIVDENYGSLSNAKQSPRVGQQVIGLGFIDALSEASILANEDINDIDGDGISGKANYVWNVKENKSTIGKFGWKANQPTLEQQIAAAFSGDMGLTTSIFPDENCPPGIDCDELYNGNNEGETVEVTDTQMSRIMVYQAAISVPIRRDYNTIDVLEGKALFSELECAKCHINNFTTDNNYSLLTQLENITIRPYSDFLLHDMGDDLADNRADFLANGNEWRTQPLWGLGMIETVNDHTFLLHDGRARNIEEAILWHGGEAENAKNNFKNLSKESREQVLKFLNSL